MLCGRGERRGDGGRREEETWLGTSGHSINTRLLSAGNHARRRRQREGEGDCPGACHSTATACLHSPSSSGPQYRTATRRQHQAPISETRPSRGHATFVYSPSEFNSQARYITHTCLRLRHPRVHLPLHHYLTSYSALTIKMVRLHRLLHPDKVY